MRQATISSTPIFVPGATLVGMTQEATAARPNLLLRALAVVGGLLVLMWLLEMVDQSTGHSLDQFGIVPRDPETAGHIMLAPWLHFGWGHLIANSGPFLVLGVLTYIAGFARWLFTTLSSVIVSGVTVWLTAPAGSITAGASGLVFGYLTYLLIRGFFTRKPGQIVLAVLVLIVYGSVLFGVLPTASGVSWQGHLGGAVGGGLAAWLQHGRNRRPHRRV